MKDEAERAAVPLAADPRILALLEDIKAARAADREAVKNIQAKGEIMQRLSNLEQAIRKL